MIAPLPRSTRAKLRGPETPEDELHRATIHLALIALMGAMMLYDYFGAQ